MRKFLFGLMASLVAATASQAADKPLTFVVDGVVLEVKVVSARFKDYKSFRAAITSKTVECPTLVVNAPAPKTGIYYVATAAEIAKFDLEDGLWSCCLDEKGEAIYSKIDIQKIETVYSVSPVETCVNGRCYR